MNKIFTKKHKFVFFFFFQRNYFREITKNSIRLSFFSRRILFLIEKSDPMKRTVFSAHTLAKVFQWRVGSNESEIANFFKGSKLVLYLFNRNYSSFWILNGFFEIQVSREHHFGLFLIIDKARFNEEILKLCKF